LKKDQEVYFGDVEGGKIVWKSSVGDEEKSSHQ
jgi:hypothetical protein